VQLGPDALQVVCADEGVPHALPDAHVGVKRVSISGIPVGPPPVQVVGLSGQLVTLGVLPQTPAPLQVGVNVVKLPALQVVACVEQTVSVGVPEVKQPLPAVLHAAVNVRRVGTLAPETQVGEPAVHAVVDALTAQPPGSAQLGVRVVSCALVQVGPGAVQVVGAGVAGPQAVPLAQAGVNVVKTGAPPTVLHVSGESAQALVAAVKPQPPGRLHVGVRVVSVALVQVGPGAVHVVAVGVAGPQAVPLAQAGVKVVNTRVPPVPVVQVSGESAHAVVLADTPQPPGRLQVGVRVVSCALAQVGPGAVQVVAAGVGEPQAVALAQAGVKVVKTREPPVPVVQVSGESLHGVVPTAPRPQPPLAVQVAVKPVSWPPVHDGFPGVHGVVDSVKLHDGFAPPPHVGWAEW
jgi:hypothetical protein